LKIYLGDVFTDLQGAKESIVNQNGMLMQELVSLGVILKTLLVAKKVDEDIVRELLESKLHIFDSEQNFADYNKKFDASGFKHKLQTLNSVSRKYES